MSDRSLIRLGLAALLTLSILPAISAGFLAPPGNDFLLHGPLVRGAAETLSTLGWTAFQDPWFADNGAGFPAFHHYPRLPQQIAATLAVLTGIQPETAMAAVASCAVLLIGPAGFVGARWLGLPPLAALLAAVVAISAQSVDAFGHTPLSYGFNGHGLYGQTVGMLFAMVAVPAWWRATRPAAPRIAAFWTILGAVLLSLVIRSSLPAGWLCGVAMLGLLLGEGRAAFAERTARATLVGALAVVLSLGFLLPFLTDLGASGVFEESHRADLASFGAAHVLGWFAAGSYLDAGAPVPWTLAVVIGLGLGDPVVEIVVAAFC